MKAAGKLIGRGLIAAALSVGAATAAKAQAAQGGNAPAAPSPAPAAQSKTEKVQQVPGASGTPQSGAKEQVTGTQPAAPASKPGSQATPAETTHQESTTK